MKKILALVLSSFVVSLTISIISIHRGASSYETPPIQWNRTYGGTGDDVAFSVIETPDGGFALAGNTYSFGSGLSDFWLVKTDWTGDVLWNKTYGGPNYEDALSVTQTDDGGYAMVGSTYAIMGVSTDYDLWLLRTDHNGNHLWNKSYGGVQKDVARDLVQTTDGGFALTGSAKSFGAGMYDFWLVKTHPNGTHEWNMTYGGTGGDEAFSVAQTIDGGYAIAGHTYSFGVGQSDFWLVKTDSTGHHQWNKTYGGASRDEARSMIQTSDGGYALAGYTNSLGAGNWDFWLVKTDSTGHHQWNKTYGGADADEAFSIIQTSDGGYAIAGYTKSPAIGQSDFWLVKTDSTGHHQWNNTCGGADYEKIFSVIQTSDGGYALAGYTNSLGAGGGDFWLVKLAHSEISATVDVDPDTLNLKSKGKWITAYIELPEGYNASDIDISTILLNDTIPAEIHPTSVGDKDGDGIPDLMVKFDRAEVTSYILANVNMTKLYKERFMKITLTMTGYLNNDTLFQGSNTVKIIMPTLRWYLLSQ